MHDRSAHRCNVDAPEGLRRGVEGYQDRGAYHRRVRDGDEPAMTGGQRVHPVAYALDELDDGFTAVRRPGRIGEPDGEVRGPHSAQHVAAPPAAVEVGQPVLDACLKAEEFGGLSGALLGPAVGAVRDS